jgi:predicted nucleic acid-binding protein
MRRQVLVDTGPIIAFLNRREIHHRWAKQELSLVPPPFLTCEAVLSEACFLLRNLPAGVRGLMELAVRGLIRPVFRLEEELEPVSRMMKKYENIPMSLADACLVRMSEQYAGSVVMTLDGDFSIYRRHGRRKIPVLSPYG